MQEHDDGARGFAHDLVDQHQRMRRALTQADEGDVGTLPGGDGADVGDIDLTRDHVVAEATTIGATNAKRSLRSLAISTRRCSVSRKLILIRPATSLDLVRELIEMRR